MDRSDYAEFIETKRRTAPAVGFEPESMHSALYPFQQHIVRWALWQGRAALFEDCGLGKTLQQLEWARHVVHHTTGRVLILCPLAVSQQTLREAAKLGMSHFEGFAINVCRTPADMRPVDRIVITNYEMMHHFDPADFSGIVLDESGCLKQVLGTVRTAIINFADSIPYRLAATATPAPNDLIEIANQAAYLGVMTVSECRALYFIQDEDAVSWRLKGHALEAFWQWVGTWAVAVRKPSDIGFEDGAFELPDLVEHTHEIDASLDDGTLFGRTVAVTLAEQRQIRRDTMADRVTICADLANGTREPWIIWCDLNDESAALARTIPDAIEVRGSDSIEHKERAMTGFSDGTYRVIVTKPSIAGHGMNWQHCSNVAFCGISHSYEMYYQAVRRSWRFGQQRPVNVHVVCSSADRRVTENVKRKERNAMDMYDSIIHQMAPERRDAPTPMERDTRTGDGWTMELGDSVDTIDSVADASVGVSVFSPPFPGMYVYTNSPHDMGNVQTIDEMIQQFAYLMAPDKLMRTLLPGRSCFIHICQGVAQQARDGYIGLRDFRGPIISMMQDHGWIYYGEVTIDKNPQLKAIRTKDSGLMFKSLATDAARMHPALSDMLLQFRKPGENPAPIRAGVSDKYKNPDGWVTSEDWINWARPVWYAADYMADGIRETDVLNVAGARIAEDERHLCPLQLGVIRRVVKVWSKPGEVVYSPFAGVGSEGVVALQEARRFAGGELKRSYFDTACLNLQQATAQMSLL